MGGKKRHGLKLQDVGEVNRRGKGKSKGMGKAPHREVDWGLKECRIRLGQEVQDDILMLLRSVMNARDDLLDDKRGNPSASTVQDQDDSASSGDGSRGSGRTVDHGEGKGEEACEEDIILGTCRDIYEQRGKSREVIQPWGLDEAVSPTRRNEKHAKKCLLQKLIADDRQQAFENSSGGQGSRHASSEVGQVRVFFTDALQMHRKPKGPFTIHRGNGSNVDTLVAKARCALGLKGRNNLTAYSVLPDGHLASIVSHTDCLVDGQLLAISAQELPRHCLGNDGVCPRSAEDVALDSLRLAYAKRATLQFKNDICSLSPEDVKDLNEKLLRQTQTYASDPRHDTMRKFRLALPAASSRQALVAALASSQVVIVVGETGSGKTTQCPNFILEEASRAGRGGEVTIICTQPRRIAAISVATRVAMERDEELGGTVGYAVRLECRTSRRTRLLFCTTGVLLQQLNLTPSLEGITHIVVDEAHERNLHTDFLLTLLRDLLERRADLRLIVMSATLEQGLFETYFEGFALDPSDNLPIVSIQGRTFPLATRYLEDVRAASAFVSGQRAWSSCDAHLGEVAADALLEAWARKAHPGFHRVAATEVLFSPEVTQKPDYDLIADLCATIMLGRMAPGDGLTIEKGAVLIFLPGHAEIERCMRSLRSHPGVGERAWILPLHGSMPLGQQVRVFQSPPSPERWKIVVSTNIAETSITIDDVTHVIDTGHVRETRYDPHSSMTVFRTVWVSHAAAKQRAGRASRTRPGVCWRLYERNFFESKLPSNTLCEMRRTALEELVLQLRLLELGVEAGDFLQNAPEPPSRDAVVAAVQSLVSIGALVNSPGLPMTPLGFHLAHMPVDVRVGKMLIYGSLFCCLAPMLTIAACLAHRSPFIHGFDPVKEAECKQMRVARFGHLCSDHLAACAAYDAYQLVKTGADASAVTKLCDELGLAPSILDGMTKLRARFLRHLVDIGFATNNCEDGGVGVNTHRDDLTLVRCMLCAGLFPHVAQVQSEGRDGKVAIVSREGERCWVHPSSINARNQRDFARNSAWLLFHTKVKTSQVFLQDSTLVGSIPLLLFGGSLTLSRQRTHMMMNGLAFKAKGEATAVLLKLLRREIDRLLWLKVSQPFIDLSDLVSLLLATVTNLLQLRDSCITGLIKS